MLSANRKILLRLLPLYVAAFFQGFVLFYAVEKLFMRSIGFDDAGIGLMVAVYSAIMLVIETPSGILADRWSRKGVLIASSIALAGSALVGGLSNGIGVYLMASALWGVFFAFYTGTYDSIVYDTLLEEKQESESYERWYGYVKVIDGSSLAISAIAGGLVASHFGLRDAYFWSIVPALISVVALAIFREPTLHKRHEVVPISRHVRETFGAILRKGRLLYIAMMLALLSLLTYGLLEFAQLWWIALVIPVVVFGPANALLTSVVGLGGLAAGYLRMHRFGMVQISLVVMLLASLVLVWSRSAAVIVAAQVVLGTGLVSLGVVFNRFMHEELPSNVRAGASSAISTISRLGMIPFALLFGFVSREINIFSAGWMLVVLLLPCFVLALKVKSSSKPLPAVDASSEPAVEEYQK